MKQVLFLFIVSTLSGSVGLANPLPSRALHPLACTGYQKNGNVVENVVIEYGYAGGVTWVQFPDYTRAAGRDEFHVLITVYDGSGGGWPGRPIASHRSFGRVVIEGLDTPARILRGRVESWPVIHDRPRDPAKDPRRLARTLMEVDLDTEALDSAGILDLSDLGRGRIPVKCEIDWQRSPTPIEI